MKVRVIPETQLEKNRVREHGDVWTVKRTDMFRGKKSYLCSSVKDGYTRWWPQSQAEKL